MSTTTVFASSQTTFEEVDDFGADFAKPKNRRARRATAVLLVILFGVGTFWGGIFAQKQWGSTSGNGMPGGATTSGNTATNGFGAGGFAGGTGTGTGQPPTGGDFGGGTPPG